MVNPPRAPHPRRASRAPRAPRRTRAQRGTIGTARMTFSALVPRIATTASARMITERRRTRPSRAARPSPRGRRNSAATPITAPNTVMSSEAPRPTISAVREPYEARQHAPECVGAEPVGLVRRGEHRGVVGPGIVRRDQVRGRREEDHDDDDGRADGAERPPPTRRPQTSAVARFCVGQFSRVCGDAATLSDKDRGSSHA